MSYTLAPFNPTNPYQNQVATELNTANNNFTILGQAFYNNDPTSQPILRASYINSSAPANPVAGMTWLDTSTSPAVLKVYDGSKWQLMTPLNSSGILDLSNSYIKSSVYTFRRVDLTNASSDYNLQIGEEVIINFSNTKSVPLYIATQNGSYYEMDVLMSNTEGTSGGSGNPIYLNANNTTYSNAFKYVEVFRNTGDSGVGSSTATYNSFRIGYAVSTIRVYISNYTANKNTKSFYSQTGLSGSPSVDINVCYWDDTSTAWTSLGTISFPQSSSGYILIRRLA
jgi:hypothetical protein